MPYAKGARHDPGKTCLPQTRVTVVDQIITWINSDDPRRILWLNGVAGSGKSSIANTVGEICHRQNRLGSSFVFIANRADRQPHHLLSTIARDLADFDPLWKCSLSIVIKNRSLRTTESIPDQFRYFLLEPAKQLSLVGPVTIVVDALDESGDKKSRAELLSIFSSKISELPPNFRILITSRPEPDIQAALFNNPHIICQYMEDIDNTHQDIAIFVRGQLSTFTSTDFEFAKPQLAEKSDGLFQWAATACRFITDDDSLQTPYERLAVVLSLTDQHLDALYIEILTRSVKTSNSGINPDIMNRFKRVLGTIIQAEAPVSIADIFELCSDLEGCTQDAVLHILKPLGSLLSGVGREFTPIRPLHASFKDFLVDRDRSEALYIDPKEQQRYTLLACLRIMKSGLRFNICDLETSHLLNDEVSDLSSRVEKNIPSYLSYVCRFWAFHLTATPFEKYILGEIRQFLKTYFLYWIEVLSLIKEVDIAEGALERIQGYNCVSVTFQFHIDEDSFQF